MDDKVKELKECPQCHGSGWVHVYSLLAENPCPLCNKSGKVTKDQHEKYMEKYGKRKNN